MARLGRTGFLAIAVIFHLVYIRSIFDIYFVSPIVSGMRPFTVDNAKAPAKRLVLFVGDGLRADKAFQSFPDPSPNGGNSTEALVPRPLAPFIRTRVLEHGTFGVSHTRVPTESRPGHVALIAGLYEDVSAVMTGWKLNPVNFDSVFNRSRHTWSWGSPDILPMFKEGAVPGRVDAFTYGAEAEDFTQDATHLDTWVFEHVKELFKEAETNQTLNYALCQDKNVFFLHLLGLDTTGHAYRPYSREYLHNIQIVDKGVQEITELVENFYGDNQTAFVFTADHGMSDWGSHGDGHPDNTRTPLVVWGSGVAKPVTVSKQRAPGHEDGFSVDWGFDNIQRHDVAQADIAALMAYLVGLAYPVNSVGELPVSFLAADPKTKARALLTNAQEILEMYRVKEEQRKKTELRYKPFGPLGESGDPPSSRIQAIETMILEGEHDAAIQHSAELMKTALEGLRYLQTYDWLFLRTLVTAGYLGWIAFAITTVIDLHVLNGATETSRSIASTFLFSSAFVAIWSVLYVQKSPATYYAYAVFPFIFWEEVYARRGALAAGRKVLLGHVHSTNDYFSLALRILGFVGLLEALVLSYVHREVYTLCYLAATTWPAFYGMDFVRKEKLLVSTWVLACTVMSSFTLLPAIKTESIDLILLGGSLMLAVGVLYLAFEKRLTSENSLAQSKDISASPAGFSRTIIGAQIGLVALAMIVTKSSVTSLQARTGLPLGTQVVGWVTLTSSFIVPFLHGLQPSTHYLHRLVVIFLAFAPTFIILTISYEGLFYFAFCITLVTWVRLEHDVYVFTNNESILEKDGSAHQNGNNNPATATDANDNTKALKQGTLRSLTLSDARISLFFLFLLQSAFFSTGNMATVSSFSLDAVYRLIPVFDPFSQGALLLLKLLIPFAVISANLGMLNRRLKVAPSSLFMVVMAMGDIMTLNFFYMVRDEGSWLEIGTTISHFCIASMLCIFVAGLESFSEVFVSGLTFDEKAGEVQSECVYTGTASNGVAVHK